MIDKRLGKSKKYASLKSDRSRVLYVLMYAHADCEGKIDGDPEEIKMECCPRLPYSIKEIAFSVTELNDVDLIDLYEVDEKPYIKFKRFDDFQIGIRKDREAKSFIPESLQTNSGVTPSLYLRLNLRVKEVKEVKEIKEVKKENIYSDKFQQFWNIYPKKKEKIDANKAWRQLTKSQQEECIIASNNYAIECQQEGKEQRHIKLPKTFLNKESERWKDYLKEPEQLDGWAKRETERLKKGEDK